MSDSDVTDELPILTRAPHSTAVQLRDEHVVDAALDELAVPLPDRPPFLDRLATWCGEIVSTPFRSALATAWGVLLVVMLITWLSQPERMVQTSTGPARVSCGLDVYVYGYPDHAVAQACRTAEAGRFGLFIPALLGVLAGLIGLGVISSRRRAAQRGETHLLRQLTSARWAILGIGIGSGALVVGLFALRPVPAVWVTSGAVVTARCGADSYFGGYPSPAVSTYCSRAFSTHGHILEACAVLIALGACAALMLAYSVQRHRWRMARLVPAAVFGLLSLAASRPVTVVLQPSIHPLGAGPATVSCGVDVWLAGYPQPSIQDSCRSALATRAPIGLVAGGTSIGLAAWGLLGSPRREKKRAWGKTRGGSDQVMEAL